MGLDMYLNKTTSVKNWSFYEEHQKSKITLEGRDTAKIKPERIIEVTEEIIVWRKSNAIHKWFVDNVQDGYDNCATYCVTRDDLLTLLDECKKVLADHSLAEEILPTQEGFFFGGTEYGENYFYDLDFTVKALEAELQDDSCESFYEYTSSW